MFKPTTGNLLRGIRVGLEQSVMPELTSGSAMRQLKAALHTLRRLERSWDRLPAYLAAENCDIRTTLDEILSLLNRVDALDASRLAQLQKRLCSAGLGACVDFDEVDDGSVSALAESNVGLQELVIEVDSMLRDEAGLAAPIRRICLNTLATLYTRMIDREMNAWGTAPGEGQGISE